MLVTEMSINKNMRPMIDARGRTFSEPYRAEFQYGGRPNFKALSSSRWDLNCYKLIDVLSTAIKKIFDSSYGNIRGVRDLKQKGINIKLLENPNLIYPDEEENRSVEDSCDMYKLNFMISVKDLRKSSILKGISNAALYDTIEKASTCKINIPYGFMSKKPDGSYGYITYRYDGYQTLFKAERLLGQVSNDGKYYNSCYNFTFNTPIGFLFVHNIFCGGWCKIDFDFYSLSRYANILYRMQFLPYTDIVRNLKVDSTLKSLGITSSNPTIRKKTFFRIINELRDSNFIDIISVSDIMVEAKTSSGKKRQNKVVPFSKSI